uniref:Uncharacterized protein n=1 Tax=Anguilla anguilla TaxID=7936 RepID=A0A0E9QRD6_ANGAN
MFVPCRGCANFFSLRKFRKHLDKRGPKLLHTTVWHC